MAHQVLHKPVSLKWQTCPMSSTHSSPHKSLSQGIVPNGLRRLVAAEQAGVDPRSSALWRHMTTFGCLFSIWETLWNYKTVNFSTFSCVYMCTCVAVYIHVWLCMCAQTQMCTCVHMHAYICVHVYTCVITLVSVCEPMCTVHMCTCHMCVHLDSVCRYMCTCICALGWI